MTGSTDYPSPAQLLTEMKRTAASSGALKTERATMLSVTLGQLKEAVARAPEAHPCRAAFELALSTLAGHSLATQVVVEEKDMTAMLTDAEVRWRETEDAVTLEKYLHKAPEPNPPPEPYTEDST